jgi:hypothetical protein
MLSFLDIPGLRQRLTEEPRFARAVTDVASSLGFDVNSLLGVMSSESGINPKATNPTGGATGLIQFMPATARMLGTTVEALRNMTGVEQLEYVRRFFLPYQGRIRRDEPGDYYIATFLPAYLGAPRETVLGKKGSLEILPKTGFSMGKIYEQNSVFDSTKRGFFTVGDVMAKNERRVAQALTKPPLEVADVPLVSASPAPVFSAPPQSLPLVWRSSGGHCDLPVLRVGAKGTAVTLAQILLGCDVITGVYSEAMAENYVRPFQIENSLKADTVIGPVSWSVLGEQAASGKRS